MWKSENNLKEFILSFHNVGPSDLGLTDLVENYYLLVHLPVPGSNSDTGVVGMAGLRDGIVNMVSLSKQ